MAGSYICKPGQYVWVAPEGEGNKFAVAYGARVMRSEGNYTLVCNDQNERTWVSTKRILKNMHLTSQEGVADMIQLGDMQECAILHNLETRYLAKDIYTYTGKMLVAINPYEPLPIYTNEVINLYQNKNLSEMPPHIFAISDNAYNHMVHHKNNQCILISGESGAGKTESTKLILKYFGGKNGERSSIEKKILDSNPIMEAFGNGKTVRNDNSSRFGKYIVLRFRNGTGCICGAKIETYLLEKSRIVSQGEHERNYHIFYSMLAGLNSAERERLQLSEKAPKSYVYLMQNSDVGLRGIHESHQLAVVRKAMHVLGFQEEHVLAIFEILAAILHLGNLKILAQENKNMEESHVDKNDAVLACVAKLLGLPADPLRAALMRKIMIVNEERIVMPLSRESAIEGRDAFVKAIYGAIFLDIVKTINVSINKPMKRSFRSIGVLDIFGFENFENNSFEQLCINYANENLQQFVIKYIFKQEQLEYQDENIEWQNIEFRDNQDILDMLALRPGNLMSLMDEESHFPQGNDKSLLMKLNRLHSICPHYIVPIRPKWISHFGIDHYAGVVMYNVNGFLEKNRDSFSADLGQLIKRSNKAYLRKLFPTLELQQEPTKKLSTLSRKFRISMQNLMLALSKTHPYFVRCIKPNEMKLPRVFDRDLCVRQLRYSGMMETTRIRQDGYSIRYTYQQFANRFRLFSHPHAAKHCRDCRIVTEEICLKMLTASDYQFGITKIFLKDEADMRLEYARTRLLLQVAVTFQRYYRNCRAQSLLLKDAVYRIAVLQIACRAKFARMRCRSKLNDSPASPNSTKTLQDNESNAKARLNEADSLLDDASLLEKVKLQYKTLHNSMQPLRKERRYISNYRKFTPGYKRHLVELNKLKRLQKRQEMLYESEGRANW